MTTQSSQIGKQTMRQIEETPASFYFWAMIGSALTSAWLFFTKRKLEGIFVGLWAPTLIGFALFSKLLKPSTEPSVSAGNSRQWPTGG